MKYFYFVVFIFSFQCSIGQILFNKDYHKSGYDYGNAVIEPYNGLYLIAGSSSTMSATSNDINILLVDSLGNLVWDRFIGQSPRQEFGNAVIKIDNNKFLLSGLVDNGNYLMEFDSSATLVWEKNYPSMYFHGAYSVGQTFDSNFYFVGSDTVSTLYLTNSIGDTIWTRPFQNRLFKSVLQTADSGFILVGSINTYTSNPDVCLTKTDQAGNELWNKTFGGGGYDDGVSVLQLDDGGFIVAGSYDSQEIDAELETYLIRTNSTGDSIWTKSDAFGPAHSIVKCSSGNGYVLSVDREYTSMFGTFLHQLWVLRSDTAGNYSWARSFDSENHTWGKNLIETSDGGFLITGASEWRFTGNTDVILIKLDSAGNFVTSIPGVSDFNSTFIIPFPNPASDNFQFSLSNNKYMIRKVEVYSSQGKILKSIDKVNSQDLQLDISTFSDGYYFYRIVTSNDQILSGKFIVTN